MKKCLRACLPVLILITFLSLPAQALAQWTGEVIAMQITLRVDAKSNAKSLGSVKNGESLIILDADTKDWYHVRYQDKEGYVMASYVVENPEHITTLAPTHVYAYPGSTKRVGSLGSYTRLTLIGEYQGCYVVNLREATGFIYKKNTKLVFESEVLTRARLGRVQIDEATTPRNGPHAMYDTAGADVMPGQTYDYVGMEGEWYIVLINNGARVAFIWQSKCHVI